MIDSDPCSTRQVGSGPSGCKELVAVSLPVADLALVIDVPVDKLEVVGFSLIKNLEILALVVCLMCH